MKIIICEDEERQRHILARSLESWSNSRQIELELLSFESGEELEFKKEEHLDADLYILDIEMKNQSGMDVAKWIREWNKESGIMFITGYEHFVFEGYLVKAIIAKDIDRMEELGIYEVAPEDFAVAEFVDSSKLELQRIVREGLDMLRKELE